MALKVKQEWLSTFSLNASKHSSVLYPSSIDELSDILTDSNKRKIKISIVGGRNSFGDIFLPAETTAIDLSLMPVFLKSTEHSVLEVSSNIRAWQLLEHFEETNQYVPSQSGSYLNTIAGDIAANVNGKDSWKFGNIYHQVKSFKLLTPNGDILSVNEQDSELFNATISGLGLTGIILSVELKQIANTPGGLQSSIVSTNNLDETIHYFNQLKAESADFSYAWVDTMCKPPHVGRAIISKAKFEQAPYNGIPHKNQIPTNENTIFWQIIKNARATSQKMRIDKFLFTTFNSLRYRYLKHLATAVKTTSYRNYQYPIANQLPGWNKQFAPNGMQEIQCAFSTDKFPDAFYDLMNTCRTNNMYTELCAIRKLKSDSGLLSFSIDGLAITINYTRNNRENKKLEKFERELIATVIKHNGKIYLAKFPYITKEELKAMYPGFNTFMKTKNNLDPNNTLCSSTLHRWL